jgi:hypothetical protein
MEYKIEMMEQSHPRQVACWCNLHLHQTCDCALLHCALALCNPNPKCSAESLTFYTDRCNRHVCATEKNASCTYCVHAPSISQCAHRIPMHKHACNPAGCLLHASYNKCAEGSHSNLEPRGAAMQHAHKRRWHPTHRPVHSCVPVSVGDGMQ